MCLPDRPRLVAPDHLRTPTDSRRPDSAVPACAGSVPDRQAPPSPAPLPHPPFRCAPSAPSADTAPGRPDDAGPAARRAAELTVGTGAGSPGHVAVLVVPAFRMALGTGLAGGLAAFLSFGHGYWAALSAAAVLHSVNVRSTLERALQRTLGTAAGLLIAFGVLATHPAPTALVALIVVFEFLLEYTVARNYGLGVVFLTPLALLMSDLASPAPVGTLVHDRTLGSVLGILIGLACALLVVHGRPAARGTGAGRVRRSIRTRRTSTGRLRRRTASRRSDTAGRGSGGTARGGRRRRRRAVRGGCRPRPTGSRGAARLCAARAPSSDHMNPHIRPTRTRAGAA